MARIKNAITGYFVAPLPQDGKVEGVEAWLELAKWIESAEQADNEETDDTGYYDGDGNPEMEVTSHTEGYGFSGFYDDEDPAMKYIQGLRRKTGEGRKIAFKKVESFGETIIAPATVSEIVTSGGAATEFPAFECTITLNREATVTPEEGA